MPFRTVFVILVCSFLLCSFSSVPVSNSKSATPPTEQKAQSKRQKQLHKRHNHLYKRFDQAKNTTQQARLQKKIQQVEQQLDKPGTPIFGILGLGAGILAFLTAVASGFLLLPGLLAVAVALAIAGLTLSCMAIVKHKQDPRRYTLIGLGIAGIILSCVMLVLLGLTFISLWI